MGQPGPGYLRMYQGGQGQPAAQQQAAPQVAQSARQPDQIERPELSRKLSAKDVEIVNRFVIGHDGRVHEVAYIVDKALGTIVGQAPDGTHKLGPEWKIQTQQPGQDASQFFRTFDKQYAVGKDGAPLSSTTGAQPVAATSNPPMGHPAVGQIDPTIRWDNQGNIYRPDPAGKFKDAAGKPYSLDQTNSMSAQGTSSLAGTTGQAPPPTTETSGGDKWFNDNVTNQAQPTGQTPPTADTTGTAVAGGGINTGGAIDQGVPGIGGTTTDNSSLPPPPDFDPNAPVAV